VEEARSVPANGSNMPITITKATIAMNRHVSFMNDLLRLSRGGLMGGKDYPLAGWWQRYLVSMSFPVLVCRNV
jgi:hypothetical protein